MSIHEAKKNLLNKAFSLLPQLRKKYIVVAYIYLNQKMLKSSKNAKRSILRMNEEKEEKKLFSIRLV